MPVHALRTIPEANTSSVDYISGSSSEREYMTDDSEETDYSEESSSMQLSGSDDTMDGWQFGYHQLVETTSNEYDDSEPSASKDGNSYTFLPSSEYRVSPKSFHDA